MEKSADSKEGSILTLLLFLVVGEEVVEESSLVVVFVGDIVCKSVVYKFFISVGFLEEMPKEYALTPVM